MLFQRKVRRIANVNEEWHVQKLGFPPVLYIGIGTVFTQKKKKKNRVKRAAVEPSLGEGCVEHLACGKPTTDIMSAIYLAYYCSNILVASAKNQRENRNEKRKIKQKYCFPQDGHKIYLALLARLLFCGVSIMIEQ